MKKKTDSSLDLAIWIARLLDRKGARDITVIETKPGTYIADYLVICSGTSSRHMETLIDAPVRELKKLGFPPNSIEGQDSQWMLADLGDVIIHIFDEQTRALFDLEGLWNSCPRVDWQSKKLRAQ